MTIQITLRFYEELNDYLPPSVRKKERKIEIRENLTIERIIAASGVPVDAVDLVLVNGTPVSFSRIIEENDRVSVYPVFESLDLSGTSPLPSRPLRTLRFITDRHMIELARILRLFGFDTVLSDASDDLSMIAEARWQGRIILTKSSKLLKHPQVTRGYRIVESKPDRQFCEIVRRFDLKNSFYPLTRCLWCNTALKTVPKDTAAEDADCSAEGICPDCNRIHWQCPCFKQLLQQVADC